MLQECACGEPLLDHVKKCPQCGAPNAGYRRSRWMVFWPAMDTKVGADEAIRLGYLAAFAVAVLTTVAVPFGIPGTSLASLVDAGVYAMLGLGIWRKWRPVAVLAFLLYSANLVFTIVQSHTIGVLAVFIFVGLLNGVRGTFAHARLSTLAGSEKAG
jgi:hypothetical protein